MNFGRTHWKIKMFQFRKKEKQKHAPLIPLQKKKQKKTEKYLPQLECNRKRRKKIDFFIKKIKPFNSQN